MKSKLHSIVSGFAAVFAVSFVAYAQLGGAGGVQIPYSGTLEADGAGANGPHDFRFSLFNAATGGAACDTVEVTSIVSAGSFSVVLGPLDESCVRERDVFLGIEVSDDAGANGYTALAGRQRIYAASSAATSGSGDFAVGGNITTTTAAMGDPGTGAAGFGHSSVFTSGSYGFAQSANGQSTVMNTASGGELDFRVNNSTVASIDDAGQLSTTGGITTDGETSLFKSPIEMVVSAAVPVRVVQALTDGIVVTSVPPNCVIALSVGHPEDTSINVNTLQIIPGIYPVRAGSTVVIIRDAALNGPCNDGNATVHARFWPIGLPQTF